ncbi:hypothetical protein [Polymorphospora rubra]|uniref:Uncharacterized protein n=1 Tax=Polymorphospora rubra TaxID=338584 RepID=A0A810MZM0_9ACTN|nr:hypothetical protein [Polymorphospora rubra]BCJ66606.1 hypothetical protein Prubr_36270 [Polymorphospora rubra]
MVVLALIVDRPRTSGPDLAQLRAEAAELGAHAVAAQERAGRAGAVAVEARAAALVAQRARDEAWTAQERAAKGCHLAWQEVLAARETAGAVRGGNRARSGDDGGDPVLVERERTAERWRMRELGARRVHDRANLTLGRAEEVAGVAETAARALFDEAVVAATEAHEAMLAVEWRASRARLR